MTRELVKRLLLIFILALIYFISAKLGLKLAFVNASSTAVWPPTGIALAAFLLFGFRIWPAIFIGAFLANLTTAGTILTSIGIALGNTLEGIVGAWLINKFANGRFAFAEPKNIFIFAILGGMIAPTISATIGNTTLTLAGLVKLNEYWDVWFTWWLGDLGGALILAPLILVWSTNWKLDWNFKKTLEAVLILFVLVISCWVSFARTDHVPVFFIVLPVLLWVAFRFGVKETVTATTILASFAIWYTIQGFGPFVLDTPNHSLLLLQTYLAVITVTKIIIAAAVEKSKEVDRLKSEFVSMASHELRTPMAAIKGLVAMLLAERYGAVSEELKKPINNIALSIERLINLVNDLLDVSRIESGRLQPSLTDISLESLVSDVVSHLQLIAKPKGLNLEVRQIEPLIVKTDSDMAKQILYNLIGNAIKFTTQGSIIVSSQRRGRMVEIDVVDTGMGIARENQAKVFDKFQQLSSNQTGKPIGTGLGLYISRQLAKKVGGRIWLKRSNLKEGSIFTLSLPISSSRLAQKLQNVV